MQLFKFSCLLTSLLTSSSYTIRNQSILFVGLNDSHSNDNNDDHGGGGGGGDDDDDDDDDDDVV